MDTPKWLTVTEAAKALSVSGTYIRNAVRDGRNGLRGIQVSETLNTWLIDPDSLEAFRDATQPNGEPPKAGRPRKQEAVNA